MPDPKPLDRDGDGGAATHMSLRDWFAGQAIKQNASYVADLVDNVGGPITEIDLTHQVANLARAAYLIADAMILEGAK